MTVEELGMVSVPSGVLTLCDAGHIGMYLNEEIPAVPVVRIEGMPKDRALRVIGKRLGKGRFKQCWDWVAIEIGEGLVKEREPEGEVMVDFARILVADADNANDWIHDDSVDGLADFVFWGRDAEALAQAIEAPALDDGNFGWTDLPIDDVVAKGTRAEEVKDEHGWKLATDFRPHSHHWQALEGVRASDTESATIEVGDRKVCLFMTSWGDGLFPVFTDRTADGTLVRVRIQMRTKETEAAMAAVND